MDIVWIALVSVLAILLVIYVIRKNQKDKRELENKLNQDYRKPPDTDVNDTDPR